MAFPGLWTYVRVLRGRLLLEAGEEDRALGDRRAGGEDAPGAGLLDPAKSPVIVMGDAASLAG